MTKVKAQDWKQFSSTNQQNGLEIPYRSTGITSITRTQIPQLTGTIADSTGEQNWRSILISGNEQQPSN